MIKKVERKDKLKEENIEEKNKGGRPPIWGIEKWTDEIVIEELKSMLKELEEDKTIIYIGELFLNKPYSRSSFLQQVGNRKENDELRQVYNTIKEILETRAVKGLINNEFNATGTIFHLKNNYKWTDKTEVANTNTNVDVTDEISEEQKKLIAERFK